GSIYIGVTSDLLTRISQHRLGEGSRFTDEYWCRRLVWYEVHLDMRVAIQREKSLKRYLRAWKIELIEKENPNWIDLWESIVPGPLPGERRVTPEQLLRGEVQELPGEPRERKILGSRPSALPEDDSRG
ncbi:MAG TPA: GIY-YIG nuclease family protein, partial [Hyphomonadaceae bacterium]|nr:GIY-YIG nuclease family protein [Hyphomonadaceae bacterium]